MTNYSDQLIIETCILDGKKFIPLDDLQQISLDDPDRVVGSVRVTANGVHLIDDRDWTDIEFWWGFMIAHLESLVIERQKFIEFHFTSGNGIMRFLVDGNRLTWEMYDGETRRVTLDLWSTVRMLHEHCEAFFRRIKILNPNSTYNQDLPLADLAKLAPAIRDAANPQQ